jgi:G3E family GTPase
MVGPATRTETISVDGRDPLPFTLLTGFLAAGKTTLLNRILNSAHGLRVGVLVNDFEAINIDAELVCGIEENTINLTNGCVCCEIRDDLVKSLEQLLTREQAVDYVLLEASGVADPEEIVMTFLDRKYERLLKLDSITCIIDAEAIFTQGDNEQLNQLKIRQIGFADMVVLNKVDLVGKEHIEVIKEWVDHHIKRVRTIESVRCNVPLEILLAVGRFNPEAAVVDGHKDVDNSSNHKHQSSSGKFDTWSYETDKPFSREALRKMVQRELSASIYRCKGIVHTADNPDKRFSIQIVGRRTEITELDEWGERTPCTKIVAIGESGKHDPQELHGKFEYCIE